MNKKLVVAAALVCGAIGMFLAGSVKAQDAATDNSAMSDNAAMNADNADMNTAAQ